LLIESSMCTTDCTVKVLVHVALTYLRGLLLLIVCARRKHMGGALLLPTRRLYGSQMYSFGQLSPTDNENIRSCMLIWQICFGNIFGHVCLYGRYAIYLQPIIKPLSSEDAPGRLIFFYLAKARLLQTVQSVNRRRLPRLNFTHGWMEMAGSTRVHRQDFRLKRLIERTGHSRWGAN
jgi:hypothetical protein